MIEQGAGWTWTNVYARGQHVVDADRDLRVQLGQRPNGIMLIADLHQSMAQWSAELTAPARGSLLQVEVARTPDHRAPLHNVGAHTITRTRRGWGVRDLRWRLDRPG